MMNKKITTRVIPALIFFVFAIALCGCGSRTERLYKRGIKYARQERYERAVVELKRLLQIDPDNWRAHNAIGQIYRCQNRYSLALEELEKALELDKSAALPAYNLATLHQEMEDYTAARENYREALRRDPQFAPALYRLGIVSSILDDPTTARDCYEKFINADPEKPEFGHNNLGVLLWYQGKDEDAVKEFSRALETNPDFFPALFNFGISRLRGEGKNEKAVESLQRYLKLSPRAAERERLEKLLRSEGIELPEKKEIASKANYLERGVEAAAAGNFDQARMLYEKALRLDPRSLQAHYRLGTLYQKHLNNKRKAIEHYEKFLDYDHNLKSPLAAEVIARLGKVRSELGYRILTKADLAPSPPPTPVPATPPPVTLTPPPKLPEDYFQAGMRDEKRGRLGSALRNFEKAISLDPKLAPAHFHAGLVYFREGRYRPAREAFTRAGELDSSLPVRERLAETYLKLGEVDYSESRFQSALDNYREARKRGKKEEAETKMKKVHRALYRSLAKKEDFEGAAVELKAAIELASGSASDYLELGDIYALKLNRPDSARPYYEKFIRAAPASHPEADRVKEFLRPAPTAEKEGVLSAREHYNRGANFHQQGKTALAEKEYQAAIELKKDFPEAYYNLGVLYKESQNFARALTFYKKAVQYRPDFPLAHLALFKLYYYRFKIKPNARHHARKYIQLAPATEQAAVLRKWLAD